MSLDTTHSQVNGRHNLAFVEVTDLKMAELDFKPKAEWNPDVSALPNGFENEVNESHRKLLNLEMSQKQCSVVYVFSTYSPLR